MVSDDIDPDWPPPAYDPSDDVDTTKPGARRWSGRTIWLVAGLVVLLCGVAFFVFAGRDGERPVTNPASAKTTAATVATTSPGGNPPATPCGPDQAGAIAAALAKVPPDRKTGKQWDLKPESSNYDACANLSAIVLTVQDATRSSPDLSLLFHRGAFVGTATPKAFPFTDLEAAASTDDVIVLTYRTRQSCDACTDGTLTTVGFQWKDGKVQTLDALPESLDSPP